MNLQTFRRYALVALASIGLAACGINSVPTKEEAAKAQWGNVESALQRRSDLIPDLVQVVQAAAISEQNILTGVIDARARAFTYTHMHAISLGWIVQVPGGLLCPAPRAYRRRRH